MESILLATFCIIFSQVTDVHSYADLRVRLLGWEGDGDKGNGNCCDPLCIGECDPYFQLCVTSNEQTYHNWGEARENCDYIWKEIDDDDHFHNADNIPGTVLSAEKRISSWHKDGATAWIRVWDADYDSDDYIDTFSQRLILRPYQYADDSREKRLTPTRGDRPNYITVAFDVFCLTNYYGASCDIRCRSQNSIRDGHYTCHPMDGYKICRSGYYDNTTSPACISPILNCEEEGIGYCKNGECVNDEYTFHCECHPGWEGLACSTDTDECLSNPCQHGGTCSNLQNSYSCSCTEAYTGTHCETEICDVQDPCLNGGTCRDALECDCSQYYDGDICQTCLCQNRGTCLGNSCICRNGYTGPLCETNIDDCVNHQCLNGARCEDRIGWYRCHCQETDEGAFVGTWCQDEMCDRNPNLCKNGGTCYGLLKCDCPGITSGHRCDNCLCVNGKCGGDTCECEPGYTGEYCDVEIDECESDPCMNGATCENLINGYSCVCASTDLILYTGSECQDVVCELRDPCLNRGTCYGNSSCACFSSYSGAHCETCLCAPHGTCIEDVCVCDVGHTGIHCETDIDECQSDPCQNGGTCDNRIGRYHCACDTNSGHIYTGAECQFSVCELANPCLNGGECYGNSSCYCEEVYTGSNCETCLCQEGTCNGARCECTPGYTGIFCETDINECASNPCENGGSCTDELNRYTCECAVTQEDIFTGTDCESTLCEIENPCFRGECYGNRQCRCPLVYDSPEGRCRNCICDNGDCLGTSECSCWGGFEGDMCETEIDECSSSPCKNGGTCNNEINRYSCDCHVDFMGYQCQVAKCDNSNPCVNGECYGDRQCNCPDVYQGTLCETCLCVNGECNGAVCECDPGWKGKFCDEEIDECLPGPCKNGGTCHDHVNAYTCDCDQTGYQHYTGDNCQHTICSQNNPCQSGGSCHGDSECSCLSIYAGDTCEECRCARGTCVAADCQCESGWTGDLCETEINECDSSPCLNGAECEDLINGYTCDCENIQGLHEYTGTHCQHTLCSLDDPCLNEGSCYGSGQCACRQIYSGDLCGECLCVNGDCELGMCRCDPGFEGLLCETDTQECDSNPCQNGGTCQDGVNRYYCECDESGIHHYTGGNCETTKCYNRDPCQNGGTCHGNYECTCLEVYDGSMCENCKCVNGLCSGDMCICEAGYTGMLCDVDIEECASNPCQNGGLCRDLVNGFECDCDNTGEHHYTGDTCQSTLCTINDPCGDRGICHADSQCDCLDIYDGDKCENCKCVHGYCQNDKCVCYAGYEGNLCEDDKDECESNPCQNGATCRNEINKYTCECSNDPNHLLHYTGTNCEISQCDVNNVCRNGGTCYRTSECQCPAIFTGPECETCLCNNGDCLGSSCRCRPGYTGSLCEDEIDECEPNPCRNGGTCKDLLKGYQCECDTSGDTHYVGENCEITACELENNCQNGGTCYEDSDCLCHKIYGGEVCEICNCIHGECDGEKCKCQPGYTGALCDVSLCSLINCQNGGTCNSGVCFCAAGYTGVHCDDVTGEGSNPIASEVTSDDGGGLNWIIAAIVTGTVALIALVVILALFCRSTRRKRKTRTRAMSTQAFVNSMDNPGYDEQPVGTHTEPAEEETENDYENIGGPTVAPPIPVKTPLTNFKPPAYLDEKGQAASGPTAEPLPVKRPPEESTTDDPFDSNDELPDIVPSIHPPLFRSLSDQSSLRLVPQRTGFPGNSVRGKRRASLAKDVDLTESGNFQMAGTVWNPSYKRRDSTTMYTNC